jgi:hypothetical protein
VKAREPRPDISTALTVPAFCEMFCLTEEMYAALRRNHLGPRTIRLGDRIVIPLEYAAMWRVEIEGLHTFARRWLRSGPRM